MLEGKRDTTRREALIQLLMDDPRVCDSMNARLVEARLSNEDKIPTYCEEVVDINLKAAYQMMTSHIPMSVRETHGILEGQWKKYCQQNS